jgi:hypothetical protein
MRSVLTPCSEIHFPNLPPPYLRDESHNLLYYPFPVVSANLRITSSREAVGGVSTLLHAAAGGPSGAFCSASMPLIYPERAGHCARAYPAL